MPRQAIVTRYMPPTNRLDGRIRVTSQTGSLTVPWADDADEDSNHERAATTYALNREWLGPAHSRHSKLVGGTLPDGSRVFVLAPIGRV